MTVSTLKTKPEYSTTFLPYSTHNPNDFPSLKINEVHLWRADLNLQTPQLNYLVSLLSGRERDWARHRPIQNNRLQALAARGLLRLMLGRYLACPPTALRFCYTPPGKPYLASGQSRDNVQFSLAYSQGMAIYIFGLGRRVGVDLELIRTDFDCEPVAEAFFSIRERAILSNLPPQDKHRAFFACWTRKEAYIKAVGRDFSLPIHQFEVSLTPGQPATFLNQAENMDLAAWSLREIIPAPGYVGAIAVEGQDWHLRCWQ